MKILKGCFLFAKKRPVEIAQLRLALKLNFRLKIDMLLVRRSAEAPASAGLS